MKKIITRDNILFAISVIVLVISVCAEHRFCFSNWIDEMMMINLFVAVTVIVQALIVLYIAHFVLKEYAKRHWVVMTFVSCILPASVFFLMLHMNYTANADANSEAAVQAFKFNLTPFAMAAVLFLAVLAVHSIRDSRKTQH